jgi:hypothetical protein
MSQKQGWSGKIIQAGKINFIQATHHFHLLNKNFISSIYVLILVCECTERNTIGKINKFTTSIFDYGKDTSLTKIILTSAIVC